MPTSYGRNDSRHRFEIIDPSALDEERDYCLTCEKFADDGARAPDSDS